MIQYHPLIIQRQGDTMGQLTQREKFNQLKQLSDQNFTNRTMFMLAGLEDILTKDKYIWIQVIQKLQLLRQD